MNQPPRKAMDIRSISNARPRSRSQSVILSTVLLLVACSPGARPASGEPITASLTSRFLPKASLQQLMNLQIDPAADFIWGSVGTVITRAGTENREPRTDAEWQAVRDHSIALIEATNLLLIPGRRVAEREFPSDAPGVLSSSEIEHKIERERAAFDAFAIALRKVGLQVLLAADRKDVAALSEAGEAMDGVCEACHVSNWYPHQIIPPLPDFK
jgi:hypothetical protein